MCNGVGRQGDRTLDLSLRECSAPELGALVPLTVSNVALTEGETTQKSSIYELRRMGWRQTRCRLHEAASAVTMSENTAHDGPSPNGKATIVK